MIDNPELLSAIDEGWHAYHKAIIEALRPLDDAQLAQRAAPQLRSVGEIVRHIIGARARWFHLLMGEGGDEFKTLGRWDRRGARARSTQELIRGLECTWEGMQAAIAGWSPADWEQTWPGEGRGEPEVITRHWVIWHVIEHDLHHGGEVSLTLGASGILGIAI